VTRRKAPPKPKPKPPRGNAHKPTDLNRKLVRALYIGGWKQEEICPVIGVSEKTLRAHYRNELDIGKAHTDAMVTMSIVHMAQGGAGTSIEPADWRKANPLMAKLYAECRMGWRPPKQEVGLSGSVGHLDLSNLSDADLERVDEILSRISGPSASGPRGNS
jgi:hypothetical protein